MIRFSYERLVHWSDLTLAEVRAGQLLTNPGLIRLNPPCFSNFETVVVPIVPVDTLVTCLGCLAQGPSPWKSKP